MYLSGNVQADNWPVHQMLWKYCILVNLKVR